MNKFPRIIFFGTPEFAVKPLAALVKNFNVAAVVANPDEPSGRRGTITPMPVKALATKSGISVLQPEKLDSGFMLQVSGLTPDLFVVAAYGKIIPKEILEIPKFGSLNIHPSLLPRWRGASPVQYAILNGDAETGVTIMLMDEKMDHGPILTNSEFRMQNAKLTAPELSEILSKMGAELIVETIPGLVSGGIKPIPQDEAEATYSKILKKEDGKVDWLKTAEELDRQIRAFVPWPGSFTFWQRRGKEVKLGLFGADIVKNLNFSDNIVPGAVLIKDKHLLIKTGKEYLEVLKIQPEGKSIMAAREFINGYGDIDGVILVS